ncbi:pyridoxamine 5'-phosphate oxidase family protein [Rhodococcus sp. ACS1]|uniref:pyridoxamine 5'-phosphate oxidase family protein n=2 Tax=Rhodococcus TaxID=1827 RepID=UPI00211CDED7|nr:pyridoxamine 5'-phosphate oxidase family protein [Rhodococcus sp. ACS1]
MAEVRQQRRGRSIAMTQDEIDSFLAEERTCRVATVDGNGTPHVVPLWFVWDGTCLWLNSIVRSQRWKDVTRDPRVSIVIDAGHGFGELRGVEISGHAESVGDVPRGSSVDSRLTDAELRFARKYTGSDTFTADGRHGWLRVTPSKIVSWDFRKTPKR